MAIIRQEDIVNGGEIVMITGTVDRIIIKEAEQTAKNIEFGVTHVASIVVADQWINFISLGIKEGKEPNIAINTGTKDSPKWVQIQETDEVKVVVKETIKGDKTYYNAKRTSIKLVKKNATPGQAPQQQASGGSGSYTKEPYDETGMLVCHGINGAMNLITTGRFGNTNEDITTLAKAVHEATTKLKKQVAQDNPDMKDKSVGNYSGNAIHAACSLVENGDNLVEDLFNTAYDLVTNVTLKLDAHIRAPKTVVPPTAVKTTRAAPAKKAPTKAAPVKEEAFPDLDDDSDPLPF